MYSQTPFKNPEFDRTDLEGQFIGGEFLFSGNVPKERKYLLKYFTGKLSRSIVTYYLIFGTVTYFMEHTGIKTTSRYLKMIISQARKIEAAFEAAKANSNIEKIAEIKSGNWKHQLPET